MDLRLWTHLLEVHQVTSEARDWIAQQPEDYIRGLHDGMHGQLGVSPVIAPSG